MSLCAGIWLTRPLITCWAMLYSPPPCSQILSVRLGAPTAGLPLPSAPWQAAQTVLKVCSPFEARSESFASPARDST